MSKQPTSREMFAALSVGAVRAGHAAEQMRAALAALGKVKLEAPRKSHGKITRAL